MKVFSVQNEIILSDQTTINCSEIKQISLNICRVAGIFFIYWMISVENRLTKLAWFI